MGFEALNQGELAELLGVSTRTVYNWHTEGLPRKGAGRKVTYSWTEVRPWWIKKEAARLLESGELGISMADGVPALEESRARREAALARLAELELGLEEGKLVEVEDVQAKLMDEYARVRARLLALPYRMAVRIVDGMSPEEREQLMEEDVYQALRELASTAECADEGSADDGSREQVEAKWEPELCADTRRLKDKPGR